MGSIIKYAREIFEIEAKAIRDLSEQLTEDFELVVKTIVASHSRLIVSGMGKSGIIGKKMAATFASTGTPSFFIHPGEAYHGDLGMVTKEDVILLISNSGETNEVLKIVPFFKAQGNIIIAMTGNEDSTLARNSHYHLNIAVEKEGCPLDLAPMASATATLVMGDALAAALMRIKDFKPEKFAMFHPGGSLGRRLLTTVEAVMKTKDLPILDQSASIHEIVHEVTKGRLGLVVIQSEAKIVGIVTDGDIRRAMEFKKDVFFSLSASDIMTGNPKSINKEAKLSEVELIMNKNKISSLLVTEESTLIGVIQIYDLGI